MTPLERAQRFQLMRNYKPPEPPEPPEPSPSDWQDGKFPWEREPPHMLPTILLGFWLPIVVIALVITWATR